MTALEFVGYLAAELILVGALIFTTLLGGFAAWDRLANRLSDPKVTEHHG